MQQQVYFLEMECNYLYPFICFFTSKLSYLRWIFLNFFILTRQQLNSNSVQGTLRQQDDKNQTTTSISEKDNLFQLLEQTESKSIFRLNL